MLNICSVEGEAGRRLSGEARVALCPSVTVTQA